MTEHPIEQPIRSIVVFEWAEGSEAYQVGQKGVTRIEATKKSGMYSDIAYVRVWAGDIAIAEFCQHHILGVYFDPPATA